MESFDDGVATTTRVSSIISANNGTDVDDTFNSNPSTFVSGGYNVIGGGNATDAFDTDPANPDATDGDFVNTQPGLDPLGDYGGLTLTHRPQQDSPAVDAANPACPTPATDQRGEPRPQEGDSDGTGRCDIGSFELGPPEDERGCDIRGTRGDDPLVGTAADEVICGLGGDDTIIGGGEDELRGNNGEDRLDSRAGVRGNDTIKGGEGRDRCRADKRDERRSC